jgi:hypothetical protein
MTYDIDSAAGPRDGAAAHQAIEIALDACAPEVSHIVICIILNIHIYIHTYIHIYIYTYIKPTYILNIHTYTTLYTI